MVLIFCINAVSQTPVIKMTSAKAIGSEISFFFKAKESNTPIKVDFGDSVLVDKTIGSDITKITGTIVKTQNICIYGDNIMYFGCSDDELITLDVSKATSFAELDCSFNQLTSLDLNKNLALKTLNCRQNHLTSLDLSENINLKSINCGFNLLISLNISKDTALTDLWCGANQIPSLNVSNNLNLVNILCDDNKLTSLDVSNNYNLQSLDCGHNELSTLDISNNTELTTLYCAVNQICEIDLSKNTKLIDVWCGNNNISQLDISKIEKLELLDVSSNNFTFATIPLRYTGSGYNYAPQKPMVIGTKYNTSEKIDLSSQLLVKEKKTSYIWKTKTGATLIEGKDYILSEGRTVFLNPQTDSVYCEMTNLTFPDFSVIKALKTTLTKIEGSNSSVIIFKTTKPIGTLFSYSLKAKTDNTPIKADFGDFDLQEKTIGTSQTLISGIIKGSQNLMVFGSGIIGLDCSNNQIVELNISTDITLTELACTNNLLTFATLPVKQPEWTTYNYAPQNPIPINNGLDQNFGLDLSYLFAINGNTSTYQWKTQNDIILTEGIDYNITNGKTVFLKALADSVRCEMKNIAFPDLTGNNILSTSYTKVVDSCVIEIGTDYSTGADISLLLKANTANTPIKVNFGDGLLISRTIGNTEDTIIGTLVGSKTVKLYGLGITYFSCSQKITKLDVIRDTCLQYLSCSNCGLTSLDVSNCKSLMYLSCSNNSLSSLDLRNNTSLGYLSCSNNEIATLDIKGNTALTELFCDQNKLTILDVTKNSLLESLYCSNNFLSFFTLPRQLPNWKIYNYAPQKSFVIVKEVAANTELDLSSQLLVNLDSTFFNWKTKTGYKILKQGYDYKVSKGITVFLQAQVDSVYCEMTNVSLPNLKLRTSNVKITGVLPAIIMTSAKSIGENITFFIAPKNENIEIQIDFGDGNLISKSVHSFLDTIRSPLIGSKTVKIYGSGIDFFACNSNRLITLDVTNCSELQGLFCSDNELTSIDLSWCKGLIHLNISQNYFETLPSSSAWYQGYSYNNLTFATLPYLVRHSELSYRTPQRPMSIPKEIHPMEEVNLNSQYYFREMTYPNATMVDYYTTYVWKTQRGQILIEGSDYTISDGVTTFIKPLEDSVYCEMTNGAFPEFSGSVALRTIYAKVESGMAIPDLSISEIEIYTHSKMLFVNSIYNAHLSIFDINGRLVISQPIFRGTSIIQLQIAGVYFVRINWNKGLITKKVIVE